MIIINDLEKVPAADNGRVLMIGNFDGFHRGHQALLKAASAVAQDLCEDQDLGAEVAALTPSPHPRLFFAPHKPLTLLTPGWLKYRTMAGYGLETALVPRFDARFAALEPEDFTLNLLISHLNARHIVVGEGFRFGHKRRGDTDMLTRLGRNKGCGVTALPPVKVAGDICSSSRIRDYVASGNMAGAEQLLGHALPITRQPDRPANRNAVMATSRRDSWFGLPDRPQPAL